MHIYIHYSGLLKRERDGKQYSIDCDISLCIFKFPFERARARSQREKEHACVRASVYVCMRVCVWVRVSDEYIHTTAHRHSTYGRE